MGQEQPLHPQTAAAESTEQSGLNQDTCPGADLLRWHGGQEAALDGEQGQPPGPQSSCFQVSIPSPSEFTLWTQLGS